MKGHIVFAGNPWPEGHAIRKFSWSAERRGADIWFGFHLETDNYYAEREIEDDESIEYETDWDAPIVWGNYHRCTLSSDKWHKGGFRVCPAAEYGPAHIDGLRLHVDPPPYDLEEGVEDRAFHIYLLGHDSVVDHRIEFHRIPETGLFNIAWTGKIALTYVGQHSANHEFHAQIECVEFPAAIDGD